MPESLLGLHIAYIASIYYNRTIGTKYMYLGTALKMPNAKAGIVIWVDNKFEIIHDLNAAEPECPYED